MQGTQFFLRRQHNWNGDFTFCLETSGGQHKRGNENANESQRCQK